MPPLHWIEPGEFHRAAVADRRQTAKRPRGLGFAALVSFGLLLAAAGFLVVRIARGEFTESREVVPSLVIALAAVLFLLFAWPRILERIIRATIVISDRGVHCDTPQSRGVSVTFWPWDDIDRAQVVMAELEGKALPALELLARDGRRLGRIGLATEPTVEQLAAVFRSHRKAFEDHRTP